MIFFFFILIHFGYFRGFYFDLGCELSFKVTKRIKNNFFNRIFTGMPQGMYALNNY